MRYAGFDFHVLENAPSSTLLADTWQTYFDSAIDLFGPQRCMFESNFPVDKGMYSYHVLWNAFKQYASSYSDEERRHLFFETANKFYRLELDIPQLAE